jgi:hypothetical protein
MSDPDRGAGALAELKDFVAFLQNLWGLLGGISALFPLSNTLVRLIPLETFDQEGVLVWFSPGLFTSLATLVSLFVILWTFGQRREFQSAPATTRIRRQAVAAFALGVVTLIAYLVGYYFLLRSAFDTLGWESADVRRLLGEVPLLVLYAAVFASITRAFMLLGMGEYYRSER